MASNDPAKEWGLPDWRYADSYANSFGHPDQWNGTRWRWEFKRRQPEYRRAFDDLVRAGKHGTRPVRGADQREKFVNSYHQKLTEIALNGEANTVGFMFRADEELAFQHQMFFLPNPRFSDQASSALLFAEGVQVAKRNKFGGKKNIYPYQFDVSKPLAPQLEACRKHLEFLASWKGLNVKRENRHKAKFFEYLRVLDANECGVKPSEFASILVYKDKTFHGARDTLKAAELLRNKF